MPSPLMSFFGLLIYSFAPTVTIIEKLWLMIKVKYSLLLVLMIYTYVQTVETENSIIKIVQWENESLVNYQLTPGRPWLCV